MPGVCATRHGGRLNLPGEPQRFAYAHPAQKGDTNAAIVGCNQVTVDFEAIALVFALETGGADLEAFALAGEGMEPALVGYAQGANGFLWCTLGHCHPGGLGALEGIELSAQCPLVRLGQSRREAWRFLS